MNMFEKSAIWTKFEELFNVVWRTQDLGSKEFREIGTLLPSDWVAHIPQSDTNHPRRMVCHARAALERKLGCSH